MSDGEPNGNADHKSFFVRPKRSSDNKSGQIISVVVNEILFGEELLQYSHT